MATEANTELHEKPFATSASLPELNLFLASGTPTAGVPPAAFNSANHSPLVSSHYDEDVFQSAPNEAAARIMGPTVGLGVDFQNDLAKAEGQICEGGHLITQPQQYSEVVDSSADGSSMFIPMMSQQIGSAFGYGQQYNRFPKSQRSNNYRNQQLSANQRSNINQTRFRGGDTAYTDIWRQQPNSIMPGINKQPKRDQAEIYQQQQPMLIDVYGNPTPAAPAQQNPGFQPPGNQMLVCRYFLNGYCSHGDQCNFPHIMPRTVQPSSLVRSQAGAEGQYVAQQVQMPFAPPMSTFPYGSFDSSPHLLAPITYSYNMQNMTPSDSMTPMSQPHLKLPNDRLDMSMPQTRSIYSSNMPFTTRLPNSMALLQQQMQQSIIGLPPLEHHIQHQQPQSRRRIPYEEANRFMGIPLEELTGAIYAISRDQHGCRYLQSKLEEHNDRNFSLIFSEIYPHVGELMTDAFANYLCQKIFQFSLDEQRTLIVDSIAPDLVRISMNSHGTRAVQKLLDVLNNADHIRKVVLALSTNVVALMKDLNGNHVIQKCLSRLSPEHTQFIYNAATENCIDIASHRHGCCVLQRCIDHASDGQKAQLVNEISRSALILVQNEFANYVVQYVLEKALSHVNVISQQLMGYIFPLSLNKYSSNVIEKCIKLADGETREGMISEILYPEKLEHLVSHPIGNYCVQTALDFADKKQRQELFELLQPLLPALRNSTCGKRIQSKLLKS